MYLAKQGFYKLKVKEIKMVKTDSIPTKIEIVNILIMPFIKSSVFNYYNRLVTIIFLLNKVMPFCFYCTKKALVCIVIIIPISCQLSSCVKCI